MNKSSVFIIVFLTSLSAFADKYWVCFKDKEVGAYRYDQYLSEAAIENRTRFSLPLVQYTDIPVSSYCIERLARFGVTPIYASRWLNAVSVDITEQQALALRSESFVQEVSPIDVRIQLASLGIALNPSYVHIAMKQMQINSFIEDSINGKGVSIGVIDAGFYDSQANKKLKHLFDERRIIDQRDFLNPERNDIITEKATEADYHGRMVLEMLAGYNASTRELMGMATGSNYYLARTEDGNREFRGEEDTWIAAMEWMDSLGIRLISTSLGYAIKMDNPDDNYTQEQMDGKTTKISKAAKIATEEKGIFLVVSAGNEGGNPSWQIISSPADAEGVLSVGATKSETCERIEYSSIGPAFLPYLKPNVSCYSPNGTSFSAPAVAGFVACLMQRAPSVSSKDLKKIIEKSAHLYPYGNNFIGYGIPKASIALKLLASPNQSFTTTRLIEIHGNAYVIRISRQKKVNAVIFHKKNEIVVNNQMTMNFRKGKLRIRKPSPSVLRTTVSFQEEVVELVWR